MGYHLLCWEKVRATGGEFQLHPSGEDSEEDKMEDDDDGRGPPPAPQILDGSRDRKDSDEPSSD